jgi:hypothetical protein
MRTLEGDSGYSNLIGAQVVVKNSSGKIIAVSNLRDLETVQENPGDLTSRNTDIVQTFSTPPLPKEEFYELTIGSRPPVTYSRGELEASNWKLDLSIGD